MIYSRWGCELELTAYCGKHKLPEFALPLMLVMAKRKDDGKTCYYFAAFLRADGGLKEIEEAIAALPEVELMPDELQKAVKDAA